MSKEVQITWNNKEKVNKTVIDLPKGKYYIFIIENDHVKQTGKTIEVK